MSLDKTTINNILIISLSNIGDVILTFPVIDILRRDFPNANISLVIGPKAASLFSRNPYFKRIHIFDKHQPISKSLSWIAQLREETFDLCVDLRHTMIPFMIKARHKTSVFAKKEKNMHMRLKHLNRLKTVYSYEQAECAVQTLSISDEDRKVVDNLLSQYIKSGQKFVVVGSGAADHRKRWQSNGFAQTCDYLNQAYNCKPVLIGDMNDDVIAHDVLRQMKTTALNLCGKLSLIQLAALMERAEMVLVNDSAPMHLASYLSKPVLAIFGPSNPTLYGPWSCQSKFLRSRASTHEDGIKDITTDDVLNAFKITDQGVQFL